MTASTSPSNGGIAQGDLASAMYSPNGQWLLVTSRYGSPAVGHLWLATRDGNKVRDVPGDSSTWLDSDTFVVWSGGTSSIRSATNPNLGSNDGPPPGSLSNGHGAAAYRIGDPGQDATFRLWTPTGVTTPVPGDPLAWSPDGSKLAVWRAQGPVTGPTASGTVDVIAWPSLQRVASSGRATSDVPPAFDPTGRYLALISGDVFVLDTVSAKLMKMPGGSPLSDTLAWDSRGHLLFAVDGSEVISVSPDGTTDASRYPGEAVVANAAGTLIAIFTPQADASITLVTSAGAVTRSTVGPIDPDVVVDPEARGVLVSCAVAAGYELDSVSR